MRKVIRMTNLLPVVVATLAMTLTGCEQAAPQANTAAGTPAAVPAATNTPENTSAETAADAAGDPLPPNRITGNGPQITFTKLTHNFGEMWNIKPHHTTFPFRNTGTETLTIREIKADCGCTATQLEQMVFAPGEGAAIKVGFSPKGSGKQTKRITVISDAANGNTQKLAIQADIKPVVTLEPSPYLNFGSVSKGETHTRIVTIRGRYPDMIIDSVDAPNSFISAKVVADDGVTDIFLPTEPRQYNKIAVTLHRNARWGGFYSIVRVRARITHPETGEMLDSISSIHVNANVFGEIHASDTMFRVGATPPKTPFQKIITITRPSGLPFVVTGAFLERPTMDNLKLTVDPISQPGIVGYRLTVSGDPGDYMGPVNGRVLIQTNIPGEQEFRIPIAGIVRVIK